MDIDFLIETMEKQIQKPTRACVNSEASFVTEKLEKAGHGELAATYWRWVCGSRINVEFPAKVYELQRILNKIDAGFKMPEWGTYGT